MPHNYFDEQIQQGKPIVPPNKDQAPYKPSTPPGQYVSQTEFVGLPVRAQGDKVFILKGGKKHWVTSPEALASLGFKLGDEVKIDEATLAVLPEGEPIK